MPTIPGSMDATTTTVDPIQADAAAVMEERRSAMRVPHQLAVRLAGAGSTTEIPCTVRNVAEGGLYVQAPADSGLEVGRRYEIVLNDESAPDELASAMLEGCYATAVRTEPLRDALGKQVGAGLRFDQPLML